MVTIHRAHSFRLIIFTDDNDPAHVHMFGDGEAKINLVGGDREPELVWSGGMKRSDVRRAMLTAQE